MNGVSKLQDNGSTYATGNATHSLTLYQHASGALVFGAGTVQWSWGLDSKHDRGSAAADTAVRQATVNLFSDMGVQPGSLQPGLVPGTPDATAPTSVITAPASGAMLTAGVAVSVTAPRAIPVAGVERRSVDKRRRDLDHRVRHHVVDLSVDAVDRPDGHAQEPRDRHRWQS